MSASFPRRSHLVERAADAARAAMADDTPLARVRRGHLWRRWRRLPRWSKTVLPPAPKARPPACSGHNEPAPVTRALLRRAGLIDEAGPAQEEIALVREQVLRSVDAMPPAEGRQARLVVITSTHTGEGKSFVALNLAASIAEGRIAPSSWWMPSGVPASLTALLGLNGAPGLEQLARHGRRRPRRICCGAPKSPACSSCRMAWPSLPARRAMPWRRHCFISPSGCRTISFLLDTPACLESSIAGLLAAAAGQIALVVEAERTKRAEVEAALDILDACPTLQLLLNRSALRVSDRFRGTAPRAGDAAVGAHQASTPPSRPAWWRRCCIALPAAAQTAPPADPPAGAATPKPASPATAPTRQRPHLLWNRPRLVRLAAATPSRHPPPRAGALPGFATTAPGLGSRRHRHALRARQPALRHPALDRRSSSWHEQSCSRRTRTRRGDIVTTIAPSLEAAVATPRMSGQLRYTPALRLYGTYSNQDGVDQIGNGQFLTALVPSMLYLDMRGAASVLPAAPGQIPGSGQVISGGDTLQTYNAQVTPFLVHHFGSTATAQAGYSFQYSSAELCHFQQQRLFHHSRELHRASRLRGAAQRRGFRPFGAAGARRRHLVRWRRYLPGRSSATSPSSRRATPSCGASPCSARSATRTSNTAGTNPLSISDAIWSVGLQAEAETRFHRAVVRYGRRNGFNSFIA